VLEDLGLRLLRLGTKRPVRVVRPPYWVIEHLEPQPAPPPKRGVTGLAVWLLRRSSPLSVIDFSHRIIKVTLP